VLLIDYRRPQPGGPRADGGAGVFLQSIFFTYGSASAASTAFLMIVVALYIFPLRLGQCFRSVSAGPLFDSVARRRMIAAT